MKNFLSCHWENLVYINFQVAPELVVSLLPSDVEPCVLHGKTILSIVCFQFSNAKLFGFRIPFHQDFPEVNVRVYVQSKKEPDKKGVYFISEMVPKWMTVFVAKYLFGEPFSTQNITTEVSASHLRYSCSSENVRFYFKVKKGQIVKDHFSEEQEFVVHKELAFCGKKEKPSRMFKVDHRPWKIITCDVESCLIHKISHLPSPLQKVILSEKPSSIFVTDGSHVDVSKLAQIS